MLHICLAIVSLIGLVMNGYILVVVLLTKQARRRLKLIFLRKCHPGAFDP